MKTNRELYFSLQGKHNKYLTEYVIKLLLCKVNSFKDFTELLLKFDDECKNNEEIIAFSERIEKGEPYQYVLGYAYFLNEEFYVNESVLIPRQETEQLVLELIKKMEQISFQDCLKICDVCTGSGILGIELKKKYPTSKVYCSDISKKALDVVKINSLKHKAEVTVLEGDLLSPLLKYAPFDVLVCNPPYIDNIDGIDPQVLKYEPKEALLAFPGTIFYERIFEQLSLIMKDKFIVGFEIGENQKEVLEKKIQSLLPNFEYEFKIDLYNKDRFLFIWKA